MLKLIKYILGLCVHKFKIVTQGAVTRDGNKVGNFYDLQCEKCGHVKQINTYKGW